METRIKESFVKHMPGHKNSKGESAPYVIVSHETGKILSSHSSESKARKHLQDMHAHSGVSVEFRKIGSIDDLIKIAEDLPTPKERAKNPVDTKDNDSNLEDSEILRLAIIAELDAINLYEQMSEVTSSDRIKEILLDISKEEKTHVGELQALLLEIDKEQVTELEEGKKEVGKDEKSSEDEKPSEDEKEPEEESKEEEK
jgi:hypothetical protein